MKRIKGTQDFLDLRIYNFIIDQIKDHLALYRFTQIETPILESLDLFKRSLGLYTDVVSKEMFIIQPTHTDETDDRICLRPEATVSTLRAFVENGVQLVPWKVFSYGPMFRYERPQKGRFRQFYQINMEVIGSASVYQDALLIAMLDRFFHEKLKLPNYVLHINFLGCYEDRAAHKKRLHEFLKSPQAAGICATCVERTDKNPMRIFDCKNGTCQEIYANAPYPVSTLCGTCSEQWSTVQEQLQLMSVSYAYRPTLVRGLDYYNKTVFEFASDSLGAQAAFCGGGRYDQLVGQLGGKEDQPSVGAAIGIERLLLLLEPVVNSLALAENPALTVIMPMTDNHVALALLIADTLHASGVCTDVLLDNESVKSMMRRANKLGAAYAVIIGDDELKEKTVTLKNMVTATSQTIKQIDLVAYIQKNGR